jgi:hypothetical protein
MLFAWILWVQLDDHLCDSGNKSWCSQDHVGFRILGMWRRRALPGVGIVVGGKPDWGGRSGLQRVVLQLTPSMPMPLLCLGDLCYNFLED